MIWMKKIISVIIPCYNDEQNIIPFYNEINSVSQDIKHYNFEFIFVVDPANDNSFQVVRDLNLTDKRVKYIFMANRYGKEASMLAGLKNSKGDYVGVMDVDLQDPPSLLKDMIEILEKGEYDSVATRRIDRRGEPLIRSFFSNFFYKLIAKVSKLDLKSGARDFRLMNRKVVDCVLLSNEKNRFLKAIYGYTGFRTKWIEFENIPRKISKTKWSFWKLFNYALTCIFGFSNLPLLIVGIIGLLCILAAIILFIINIVNVCLTGSFFGSVYFISNLIIFFSGIQIFCMSILCYYLYSIYIETKNKPLYIVMESSDKFIKDNNK